MIKQFVYGLLAVGAGCAGVDDATEQKLAPTGAAPENGPVNQRAGSGAGNFLRIFRESLALQ